MPDICFSKSSIASLSSARCTVNTNSCASSSSDHYFTVRALLLSVSIIWRSCIWSNSCCFSCNSCESSEDKAAAKPPHSEREAAVGEGQPCQKGSWRLPVAARVLSALRRRLDRGCKTSSDGSSSAAGADSGAAGSGSGSGSGGFSKAANLQRI